MNNSQQSAISVSQSLGGCLKSAPTSDCASAVALLNLLSPNWQTQGSGWAQIWVWIAQLFVSKKKKHIGAQTIFISNDTEDVPGKLITCLDVCWFTGYIGCLLIHWEEMSWADLSSLLFPFPAVRIYRRRTDARGIFARNLDLST